MFGQKTPFDYLIGFLALAFLLIQIILPVLYWDQLPERLPVHFNFRGDPDRFGNKLSLFLLPAIGIGLFILLTVIGRNPQAMNHPVKISDENRDRVYRTGVQFVHILRMLIGALFAYMLWGIIQVGLGGHYQLDIRVVYGFLGGTMLAMVWFFINVSKKDKEA
ncbi:DUF1648 domain-containing protein [Haliscomenobacter hydrossis]|uniref:DUF1648 domain-containing protein n=1 Tax=Haliscomenobacter hydrossis (strain ATCC 27775 / DSM 1100 / LMG 10767 / O) TaxID=760192 RepID=F4KTQ8_HALH1|nr:DUF1648 domain-containing protein [Haliscomenobacter hydrossis]AEE48052.1 protein of unknown function DUF1648 [Haliscomenobacter hydrossis DSM 1100]